MTVVFHRFPSMWIVLFGWFLLMLSPDWLNPDIVGVDARQVVMQEYIDEETNERKTFDVKSQFAIKIMNDSKYRVDLYWDDGMYGSFLGTLEAMGESGVTSINTFVDHSFFVTRHGTKDMLYNSDQERVRVVAAIPNQSFVVPSNAEPSRDPCKDRFSMCAEHAKNGMCGSSKGWMIVHCCESCDPYLNSRKLINPRVRCSRDHLNVTEPVWKEGNLNALFEEWVTSPDFQKYTPVIWSSPGAKYGGKDGPWVITFDTFMTDLEVNDIIRGGEISGFERSTDQGSVSATGEQEKIISTTRTSSNAWCRHECEALPGVKSLTEKVEDVTKIPQKNYESLQILDYGPNQFYRSHHDSSMRDKTIAGPRILTFFLYLSEVEEGGETYFNNLDIAVTPKKGRALIWPSVSNDDPHFWEPRTHHEAKPVIRGRKLAANHWIHLYDFLTPNEWGCTGSFS